MNRLLTPINFQVIEVTRLLSQKPPFFQIRKRLLFMIIDLTHTFFFQEIDSFLSISSFSVYLLVQIGAFSADIFVYMQISCSSS